VRWWRNCTAFGRCWSYWWWDERSRWPPLKIGPNTLMWKLSYKWRYISLYWSSKYHKLCNNWIQITFAFGWDRPNGHFRF
jgi:hypothetical protein